jgi:nucleotide-binding universal stress UspA family protein
VSGIACGLAGRLASHSAIRDRADTFNSRAHTGGAALIENIVVGSDGSDTAAVAVRNAAELAKSLGARLHVVSAYRPLSGVQVSGAEAVPERGGAVVSPTINVDAVLDGVAGAARAIGVEPDCYARRGDPAEAILDVAEEQGADLIVVGNKGMHGNRRFLLGSVPDKVSHHAPCSVLIVRTG